MGLEPTDEKLILSDIAKEFQKIGVTAIQEAIRLGSTGKYGRTYRLTSQEVCFWIREYLKDKAKSQNKLITGSY